MDAEILVRDYLGRLEAAAWTLAGDRRSELVGEVREHIEVALKDAGRHDEVTIRNILDRLGPPEEIVSAEMQADAGTGPRSAIVSIPVGQRSLGAVEIIAVLLLTLGSFLLPVVGPMLGLIFVWVSTIWTTREKAVATLIVVVFLLVPIAVLFGVNSSAGMGFVQWMSLHSPS